MDLFGLTDTFLEKAHERKIKSVMRGHGMNVDMDIHDAALSIPGFNATCNVFIKHDVGHIVANALNVIKSFDPRGIYEEYFVTEGCAFEMEKILFGGKDITGITEDFENRVREYQTPGQDPNFYRERLYLKPENRPKVDAMIQRGLRAREFFTLVMHVSPAQVSEGRLMNLPLASFGLYPVTGTDGKTQSFEFYPDETRNAVTADLA